LKRSNIPELKSTAEILLVEEKVRENAVLTGIVVRKREL
jgi:hypothetical protein